MFTKRKIKKLKNQLDSYYIHKNFDLALSYCDMILNMDSKDSYALFIKARILVLQGNISEGMSYYKESLETEDFDIYKWIDEVSFYMDGDIYSDNYQLLNRNEISLRLCEICLEKYNNDIFFSTYKSQALDNLGRFEESLKAISLNLTPDDGEVYFFQCLGQCFPLSNLNRWEDVLEVSSNGLIMKPEDSSLISFKAKALYYLNRFDESEGFFNKYLQLTNYSRAYNFLSKIEFKRKNYKKSLKLINDAIKLSKEEQLSLEESNVLIEDDGVYDNDYYMKSLVLLKLNQFDEASQIIDCLLEKDESAKNYCLKSMILYEMDDYENALMFVNKALGLKPDCKQAIELKEKIEDL